MTIGSIGSVSSAWGANDCMSTRMRPPMGNQEDRLNEMSAQFVEKLDQDGNGTLSASEIEGLSSDAFSELDSDSDGALSEDEIKAAAKKQMEAMHAAFESQVPKNVQDLLAETEDTAEGQLMDIIRQKLPPPPRPYGGQFGFSNSSQFEATA